jgi:nitroreductase
VDIIEAIYARKSIRAFKKDPVPKAILEEVLKAAERSPSGANAQPWEFIVLTGDVLEKVKQANVAKFDARETPSTGMWTGGEYTSVYRDRTFAMGAQLNALLGIAREDKEKRLQWRRNGMRFFDDPAAIIIATDKSLGNSQLFSIGSIAQTIALAALKYGLGTVLMIQGVMYPQIYQQILGVPDSKLLVIAVPIGYPDWDAPANKIYTPREPLEKITTWVGFE